VSRRSAGDDTDKIAWILKRISSGCRHSDYEVRLWNGQTIPAATNSAPRFTLVLNHPGALRRLVWPPTSAALGEAFVRGDFDIEGDLIAAIGLGDGLLEAPLSIPEWLAFLLELLRLPSDHDNSRSELAPPSLRGSLHSRMRDRAAIRHHYDLSNEFYSLWLDSRMVYSCAYFPTGQEDIEAAQELKLDLICRKLRLQAGDTLLDIGCGWGGLVMFAAEKHQVKALGITLSEKQACFGRERIRAAGLDGHAKVECQDFRDVRGRTFDKMVSVGMAEHVGRKNLPSYFAHAYDLLKPGGVFLNHAMADQRSAAPVRWLTKIVGRSAFIKRHIFPDFEVVPLDFSLRCAENTGFEIRDMENLREHYVQTLRQWITKLEARRGEALRFVDERVYRAWRLYLAMVAYSFQVGWLNLSQVLFVKRDSAGNSGMPRTRMDWYCGSNDAR